jgi:hypothetical protein
MKRADDPVYRAFHAGENVGGDVAHRDADWLRTPEALQYVRDPILWEAFREGVCMGYGLQMENGMDRWAYEPMLAKLSKIYRKELRKERSQNRQK